MSIILRPVVTASQMAFLEKQALEEGGCSALVFMEEAGRSVGFYVAEEWHKNPRPIILLIGRGNNGGDAFACGCFLQEQNIPVEARVLYPMEECSALCHRQWQRFAGKGGRIEPFSRELRSDLFIVDGLTGTGFHGSATGALAEAITWANQCSGYTVSVDIPSGVCGDTGLVGSVAMQADKTVYLELPKWGCFVQAGWEYVGELVHGSFGLSASCLAKIDPVAFLVVEVPLAEWVPKPCRLQNKYSRGHVLCVAGSLSMPGAAILAGGAALRSGAGIVKCFSFLQKQEPVSSALELIHLPLDRLGYEQGRASALLIGPGLGREKKAQKRIRALLMENRLPCVIDADALFALAQDPSIPWPISAILTPHTGEKEVLFGRETGFCFPEVQEIVDQKQGIVLWKGAPNFLFQPDTRPWILPFGNCGMATAGSGDVLSGVIAGLLSMKMPPLHAAVAGCYIHGKAGDLAAHNKGVYSMIASDLLEALPSVFLSIRQ